MDKENLTHSIHLKKSFLCIGLDTDINKIPDCLRGEKYPVRKFNQEIIQATSDLCIAYKPNIAFYESRGKEGWEDLEFTMREIPQEIFTIADAKRGDIGNTSLHYADAYFNQLDFDAVTLSPYMGCDSILPYLEYEGKWVIILALTSNPGSMDFQQIKDSNGTPLYEHIINTSSRWGNTNNTMYVVGATQVSDLRKIREIAPKHFFLVPGIGTQGGSFGSVVDGMMNSDVGLVVNSSRKIIYASSGNDFAEAARAQALVLKTEMEKALSL